MFGNYLPKITPFYSKILPNLQQAGRTIHPWQVCIVGWQKNNSLLIIFIESIFCIFDQKSMFSAMSVPAVSHGHWQKCGFKILYCDRYLCTFQT
jgi:hypothetical protein